MKLTTRIEKLEKAMGSQRRPMPVSYLSGSVILLRSLNLQFCLKKDELSESERLKIKEEIAELKALYKRFSDFLTRCKELGYEDTFDITEKESEEFYKRFPEVEEIFDRIGLVAERHEAFCEEVDAQRQRKYEEWYKRREAEGWKWPT